VRQVARRGGEILHRHPERPFRRDMFERLWRRRPIPTHMHATGRVHSAAFIPISSHRSRFKPQHTTRADRAGFHFADFKRSY
jgi:hypothetical protein